MGDTEKYETKFCEWLSNELELHNMTQKALAIRLGCNHKTVSNLIRDKQKPSMIQVLALCYVFDSPDDPDWVYGLQWEELT